MRNDPPIEQLLTEHDVARILHQSVRTIRAWRQTGRGPKWIKSGRNVRYRPGDVQAYIDTRSAGGGLIRIIFALLAGSGWS
jgi:hypothetical protein